jgi:hypothetical protein
LEALDDILQIGRLPEKIIITAWGKWNDGHANTGRLIFFFVVQSLIKVCEVLIQRARFLQKIRILVWRKWEHWHEYFGWKSLDESLLKDGFQRDLNGVSTDKLRVSLVWDKHYLYGCFCCQQYSSWSLLTFAVVNFLFFIVVAVHSLELIKLVLSHADLVGTIQGSYHYLIIAHLFGVDNLDWALGKFEIDSLFDLLAVIVIVLFAITEDVVAGYSLCHETRL